jgi:hypothetical protein
VWRHLEVENIMFEDNEAGRGGTRMFFIKLCRGDPLVSSVLDGNGQKSILKVTIVKLVSTLNALLAA